MFRASRSLSGALKLVLWNEAEAEFQIMDRFSLMQFFGLQPVDSVPDAKTIWDFNQLKI